MKHLQELVEKVRDELHCTESEMDSIAKRYEIVKDNLALIEELANSVEFKGDIKVVEGSGSDDSSKIKTQTCVIGEIPTLLSLSSIRYNNRQFITCGSIIDCDKREVLYSVSMYDDESCDDRSFSSLVTRYIKWLFDL